MSLQEALLPRVAVAAPAAASYDVLLQIKVSTLVKLGAVFILGTILLTELLYIKHYGLALPTISGTWVDPPGSYISRWCVNVGCVIFIPLQFVFYFVSLDRQQAKAKLLLGMSVAALVALSWVGAICDETKDSCRGAPLIHEGCAVTFFVLYDIFIYVTLKHPDNRASCSQIMLQWTCLITSVLAKFQYLNLPIKIIIKILIRKYLPSSVDPIAIPEYLDVIAVVTWLVSYTITNCSAYSIAITRSTSVFEGHGPSKRSRKLALQSQDPDGIRGSVACQTLILGSSLIGLVTVIVSYISQLVTRHVCVFLPYISDSFVYPPGDWFSRWGLMIFSEGLAFYCYCVYLSDRLSNVLGKVSLLLIGFVSAFNMSLVAIINEVHARIVGRAWFRLQ
mmetsp:Transcript_2167/g.7700  ORF Transcript_2167/g.7700 Transcript_2167/m.7700 type:complete len:392 (-) Transcript_2167:2266-3441(-)